MNRIFDSVMVNDELDMLECRLTELEGIPNLTHVVVEADVDHQDHPKPFHVTENLDRFERWADRLIVVQAKGLPTKADNPDPWAREHAQREFVWQALEGADPDDIVLHGDLDEIPTAVAVRNVRPRGFVAFDMSFHCFAVDWLHPQRWRGTVASQLRNITSFGFMRDCRNFAPPLPGAGWHFSWFGGRDAYLRKLGAFCHPEIAARTQAGIERDVFVTGGFHVDGHKLTAVEVDKKWPRWIAERRCPESWFRSSHSGPSFHEDWFSGPSCVALAELASSTNGLQGSVVEIGSWEGRSTIALASAVAPQIVNAVDTWDGSPGEISAELALERDVYATFCANTRGLNIEAHRQDWRVYVAEHPEPVRFCFIDALHTYEEVRDQIAAVLPLMVPGGILCGDDAHHPPIRRAVFERFPDAQTVASVWFVKVP